MYGSKSSFNGHVILYEMPSYCSTRIHYQERKKHDYLMVPNSDIIPMDQLMVLASTMAVWYWEGTWYSNGCFNTLDSMGYLKMIFSCQLAQLFKSLWGPRTTGQLYTGIDPVWQLINWAMGSFAHGFLMLATDESFFCDASDSPPLPLLPFSDSAHFPVLPPFFYPQSVESGTWEKKEVTNASKFLSYTWTSGFWKTQQPRHLFSSGYILTTSLKPWVTHVWHLGLEGEGLR